MTPNLFIIGAARCGTTSIHSILGQHPEIHASRWKEPTFFIGTNHQIISNPIAYFNLFNSPKRYRMESSQAYLPSPETPSVLRALFPNARFIVSLREPKARAYALYRHMRFIGMEDTASFQHALEIEASRYSSREFDASSAWDVSTYLYIKSTLYDDQLAHYFKFFDRKQFYITTLASISKDPERETKRILDFLELDSASTSHFDYSVKHRHEHYDRWDSESDRLLDAAFDGLMQRTEKLVGHSLDWSM